MKKHSESLDYMLTAMIAARSGDVVTAAKLFNKGVNAPDALQACAILEASNKAAFASEQAAITAAKKEAAPVKTVAAEFDMGGDDLSSLIGDDDGDDFDGDEADEISEGEEVITDDAEPSFATVLAGLQRVVKKGTK